MSDTTNLEGLDSMDELLDKNLDDIADLPSYDAFYPGLHRCKINWELKSMEKNVNGTKKPVPHIQLTLTAKESLELSDSNDPSPAPGDKCSTMYDLTNEYALGALKKALKTLSGAYGGNLKQTIKETNDFEVVVVVKNRKDKNDKEKRYLQIEDMIPTA